MKKLICTVSMLGMIYLLQAQTREGHVYLKGGLNIANVSVTSNGEVDNANALASFHVGLLGDIPVSKFFAFQTGLLFTGKGSKLESGTPNSANYYKATTNPLYVELPLNAVITIPLASKENRFFAGAGPYIAMGVAGKRKIEGRVLGVGFSDKSNIEFSNDDPTTFNNQEGAGLGVLRRFDYGLNATAGFQLDKALLSVNYGYGLAKLQSTSGSSEDKNNKHRVLSLSIGFVL